MTGWDVEPVAGRLCRASIGMVTTRRIAIYKRLTELERTGNVADISPRVTTVLNLTLLDKGLPYWAGPDLGMGKDDVVVKGRTITVTVTVSERLIRRRLKWH